MIYNQCKIFCIFFALGILFSFIFDFFRALRKTFKANNIVIYVEDIVFVVIIGILFLKSVLIFSFGEIRFYIFIALIFGIVSYFLTIGNLCAIMFKVILDFLKKFILCFIRILKIPQKIINNNLPKIKRVSKKTKTKNNP